MSNPLISFGGRHENLADTGMKNFRNHWHFLVFAFSAISSGASAGSPPPDGFLLREGSKPSLSGDGLWVAYECNGRRTLCLSNTDTQVTEELVTLPAGQLLQDVDISRDGMVITYWIRPGTNGTEELYVYDRNSAAVELVSVNESGEPGEMEFTLTVPSLHSESHVNGNGRYVIFSSFASNLEDETSEVADTNQLEDVFLRDRQLGTTTRLSRTYVGGEGDGGSGAWGDPPLISADGRTALFYSLAENLVPGDIADDNEPYGYAYHDIFMLDIPSGDLIRLSEVPGSAIGADNPSRNPGLSPNGQFAAFVTASENLYSGPYSGTDLLLYDPASGSFVHVNKPLDGNPVYDGTVGETCTPEFNFEGSVLYFCALADNLAPGDAPILEPDPRNPGQFIEVPSQDVLAWQDGSVSLIRPVVGGEELLITFPSSNDLGDVIAFQTAVTQPDQTLVQTIGIANRGDLHPPIVLAFGLIPNGEMVQGTLIELEALASDLNRGDSDIVGAEFAVDGEDWQPFPAIDGLFDAEVEQLQAFLDTVGLALGSHTVCARAQDAALFISEEVCVEFDVVSGPMTEDFMLICTHTPLWPQPGEIVSINLSVILPPELDESTPWFPVELTEIWFNNPEAPAKIRDYYGTSSNWFDSEPLPAGTFSYGCRAKLGDTALFSGWRTVAVGPPDGDKAVAVLYTGPSSHRIDVVFIADDDTYAGAQNPEFLEHVGQVIESSFYRYEFYNRFQHNFNFWLSRNTGRAVRGETPEGESFKTIVKPVDWEQNYAFADVGAILHEDSFRDFAMGGMFTAEPGSIRTVRHEAGHAPFGLSDEYCCDSGYFESTLLSNVYKTLQSCEDDAPNLGRQASDCRSWESELNEETYYSSEPDGDDLMNDNTVPRAADIRRIEWLFQQCGEGKC